MAARRSAKSKKRAWWAVVWLLVAVVVCALAVTFSEQLGISGLPTWQELGAAFHLQQNTTGGDMPVEVEFLDVGQGDCTLISANGRHILIDAGENDQADTVIAALRKKGIKKIDIAIGTHPHSDHIGGLDAVIEEFEVGQVILPELTDEQTPTTKTYLDLLTVIADKGVPLKRPDPPEKIDIGGGTLELRGPLAGYSDLNNVSVTVRFVYDGISFWIAGDCSKEAENDLLKEGQVVKTTVYKVSHHGSDTATTQPFLDQLAPQYCVISVGKDNSYGHPHKEISRRLDASGATVYRTDLNGTVTAATDGKTITFTTER